MKTDERFFNNLKQLIAKSLKSLDFEETTKESITLLTEGIRSKINAHLKTLFSITIHSKRAKTTFLDLYTFGLVVEATEKVSVVRNLDRNLELKGKVNDDMKLVVSEYNCKPFDFIPDYMPKFPPDFTYRYSVKDRDVYFLNRKAKSKAKQIREVRKSLVNLASKNNEIPEFVNFLFN